LFYNIIYDVYFVFVYILFIVNVLFYNLESFELSAGYHNFMWQYGFDTSVENIGLYKMSIEQIEIEGVENGDYKCNKCEIILNEENNHICHTCEANTYFDKEKVIKLKLISIKP